MSDYWQKRARLKAKYGSKLRYVLSSLIPYSETNFKLAFKPNQFFNDLEILDLISKETAKTTYYRALNQGYITKSTTGRPRLTEAGKRKLKLYEPKKLGHNAKLIVIFDIPELKRRKRDHLRVLLRELKFKQVQLSVWQSDYDSRKYLQEEISYLGLNDEVKIYEALRLDKSAR